MVRYIGIAVISMFVAIVGYKLIAPTPEPVTYTEFRVDTIYGEPDTVRTFVDRIVYRDREPEVIVEQPGGGEDVVEDFCHPDTVIQVVEGDTIWTPADTVYLLRSVVDHPGWFLQRDQITVYGPTSVGDLREMRFRSYPGWSLRTDPEVLFREPRFGLVRQLIEAGIYIGIGYLGGKVF